MSFSPRTISCTVCNYSYDTKPMKPREKDDSHQPCAGSRATDGSECDSFIKNECYEANHRCYKCSLMSKNYKKTKKNTASEQQEYITNFAPTLDSNLTASVAMTELIESNSSIHFPEEKSDAEEKRIAEKQAAAEAKRLAALTSDAEEKRIAEEKAAAEAKRLAAEKSDVEEKRIAEEKAAIEAKRLAEKSDVEEKRLAAEKSDTEEKRLVEDQAIAEAQRLAEAELAAENKRLAEMEDTATFLELRDLNTNRKIKDNFDKIGKQAQLLNPEIYFGFPPGNVRNQLKSVEDLKVYENMRQKCKVFDYKGGCMLSWTSSDCNECFEYFDESDFLRFHSAGFIQLYCTIDSKLPKNDILSQDLSTTVAVATDAALPSIVSEIKSSEVLTPPQQLSTILSIIQNEEISPTISEIKVNDCVKSVMPTSTSFVTSSSTVVTTLLTYSNQLEKDTEEKNVIDVDAFVAPEITDVDQDDTLPRVLNVNELLSIEKHDMSEYLVMFPHFTGKPPKNCYLGNVKIHYHYFLIFSHIFL